jgi:hypothetical protein
MTIEYKDSKRIVALSTDFTTPIVWQNMTDGQTASGNVLSKSGANWTADATSTATFSSSVGAKVEFTVSANTSDSFCGFDISTNTDSYDMDYALYCGGGGTINIYANGSQVTSTSVTYSTADTLAVNMDSSGTVTFLKNGSVFYTSTTTASGTYRVNAVIYTSGVSLTANYITDKPTDVQDNSIMVEKDTANRYWFDAESTSDVTWNDSTDVGCSISGNTITKTASNGWTSGIGQTDQQVSASNGGTITITSNATNSFVGLSNVTSLNQQAKTWFDIKFGFSDEEIIENGAQITPDTAFSRATSDTMKITISSSGIVKYYVNDTLKHTSTITASGSYFGIFAAYTQNENMTATITTPATWTRQLPTLPTISDLVLHLDANASSTITKDSSNLVATWGDGSSASNDVTASGTTKPLWVDNVQNGLPVIRFDGSDDRMTGTTPSYSLPNTLFMVCTTPNADSEAMFDGDTSRNLFNRQGTNTYRIWAGAGVTGGTANTAMQVFTVVFNNGSPALNINGSAQSLSGTNIGTSALDDIIIGSFDGGTGIADMDVCEVLFYNKALSSSEITDIESYLNSKWSVY